MAKVVGQMYGWQNRRWRGDISDIHKYLKSYHVQEISGLLFIESKQARTSK